MASEADICNLALSHFGQDATISSIDPPDGSAEAEHCARFLPMARDEVLEAHTWTWATFRATLAELVNDRDDWAYRYALPAQCLKTRIVLPDGYSVSANDGEPFEREGTSIYTDARDAVLVYTKRITDPTKFSPTFVAALSWRLASYVAGPIVKDPTGRVQGALYKRSEAEIARAEVSDANATRARATHTSTADRAH